MPFPSDLKYFSAAEFKHPNVMNVPFLRWLNRLRERSGVVMLITNDGHTRDGPSLHPLGRAVDVRSFNWSVGEKWKLLSAIVNLADSTPNDWKVELEVVASHWHIGLDSKPGKQHEFITPGRCQGEIGSRWWRGRCKGK